ncbi:MAG: hypothetical protein HYY67_08665 [Thaumarchaeota archaeon]|nr:hypothetical protein [Nitrososphaerota archaeon]
MRNRIHNFRFAEEILNSKLSIKKEILQIVDDLQITPKQNNPKPHKAIQEAFFSKGWKQEEIATKSSGMRFDLFKDKVAIEIETSHIIHTYKDYLKFLLGFNEEKIEVGVEIVYTKKFLEKYGLKNKSMPELEKVVKDLSLFRSTIPVPILVIGLE